MTIYYTSQFKKDYKRLQKQNKNLEKLKQVIEILASGEQLPAQHKDHQLAGTFNEYRDCHIEPD